MRMRMRMMTIMRLMIVMSMLMRVAASAIVMPCSELLLDMTAPIPT